MSRHLFIISVPSWAFGGARNIPGQCNRMGRDLAAFTPSQRRTVLHL
jgi:hypothetical protein